MITNANVVLLDKFKSFPYFTYDSIVSSLNKPKSYVKVWLFRQMEKGTILSIKRGVYTTKEFYIQNIDNGLFLPMLSSILKKNSYISAEYILQKKGVLTDITYPVTAVTIGKTASYSNDFGDFYYHSIKSELFTGYEYEEFKGIRIAFATVEKALFDYLYFRKMSNKFLLEANIVEELRLNDIDSFTKVQRKAFVDYVKASNDLKMRLVLNNLKEYVWQD